MTDYLAIAGDLAVKAPAQARLLRHLLVNPGQTAPEIQQSLSFTDANFRVLIGKLRDRGIEVIVRRVVLDPADPTQAEYHYSIRSGEEIEHWAEGRREALRTAWQRVEKMMTRHVLGIEELDPLEQGIIIGALRRLTQDLRQINVYAELKIGEARAARAAEEAALRIGASELRPTHG